MDNLSIANKPRSNGGIAGLTAGGAFSFKSGGMSRTSTKQSLGGHFSPEIAARHKKQLNNFNNKITMVELRESGTRQ